MKKWFWGLAAGAVLGALAAVIGNGSYEVVYEPPALQTSASLPQQAESALHFPQIGDLPKAVLPMGSLQCAAAAAQMEAECIFISEPGTGQMRYCSIPQTDRLYPASITKLFTAWVALRFLPGDQVVTVGWELGLLEPGSSSAFLALDSRLTVEDLIRGMLLPSGNDAALVLAAAVGREIAGDQKITASEAVTEFVAEMNRAAEALDLQDSHFANPHGCHSPEHYSCPADIADIAALALEEPVIRRCMGLAEITVTIASGEKHTWKNTNRLVRPDSSGYCPEALGMKTGYTEAAGYCLLAAFGEENPLVVGIFGSPDSDSRYENAVTLYRLAEESAVQMAALHGEVQGGSGQQQDDGLSGSDVSSIDPECTAHID